ncbi:hypothetical protein K3495_g16630, partial [Podosphaera aphanis]
WEKTSHFVVNCSVRNQKSAPIPSLALIDSGASAYGFVDAKFAHDNKLQIIPLRRPRSLKVFDGSESAYGQIVSMAKTVLSIEGHSEVILLFVTTLAYFDIVLGLPWLQFHNPEIRWAEETLQFNSPFCKGHLGTSKSAALVHAISPEVVKSRRESAQTTELPGPVADIETCDSERFKESYYDEESSIMKVSVEDIEEALRDKPRIDPAEKLPKIYHEFLPVFSKDEADKLPPHRSSDHRIILKPGSEVPWGPLYGMSR